MVEHRSEPCALFSLSFFLFLACVCRFSPKQTSTMEVILKANWQADKEATECVECGRKFTLTRRRHHCRFCGRIFCQRDSAQLIAGARSHSFLRHICRLPGSRACTSCVGLSNKPTPNSPGSKSRGVTKISFRIFVMSAKGLRSGQRAGVRVHCRMVVPPSEATEVSKKQVSHASLTAVIRGVSLFYS